MGLRLIARMYDRSEALVMSSALDAAGVPHWLYGFELICIDPFTDIAYDGFRIIVCDQDVEAALGAIEEARGGPIVEGERLSTRHLTVLSLLMFFFGGLVMPLKIRSWRGSGAVAD